jgi:hypothetical protein
MKIQIQEIVPSAINTLSCWMGSVYVHSLAKYMWRMLLLKEELTIYLLTIICSFHQTLLVASLTVTSYSPQSILMTLFNNNLRVPSIHYHVMSMSTTTFDMTQEHL